MTALLAQIGVLGQIVLLGLLVPLVLLWLLSRVRVTAAVPGVGPRHAFVLRPPPGEWLALQRAQFGDALRPTSVDSQAVEGWGDLRIRARGVEIAFACERDSVEVSFEGEIESRVARRLADEIRASIGRATGQTLEIAPA